MPAFFVPMRQSVRQVMRIMRHSMRQPISAIDFPSWILYLCIRKNNLIMQKNENSLQPDNLQEIAAAQLSNPQAGEGKEDEFIMLPWQNKAHRLPKPKDLPPVFRELVGNAPEVLRTLVFVACAPALGTYAPRLRFQYVYDQTPSTCLLQVIVCGDQSSGKSFARYVQQIIMQKLIDRDSEQRRTEQKYNEMKRRKGKKDGQLPPEPKTDIVNLPPSVSITMLMKRADAPVVKYGAPRTLFMFADELSTITQSNKRAFSDRYMDKNAIEGGNITRTILCQLESHIGDEPPTLKVITPAQQQVIDHTIEQLMAATYQDETTMQPEVMLDTQWLEPAITKWCGERRVEALKSCSKALDVFYKRSSVSAFRIACLCQYLYQLEGKKDEKTIHKWVKQIYLAMADYTLYNMISKWGAVYEQINADHVVTDYRPSHLFENLPSEFTRDLLKVTLEHLEQKTPAKNVISRWVKLGWIEKVDKNQFRKLKQ